MCLSAKDASVASSPTTTSNGSWKSAKRKSKEAHGSLSGLISEYPVMKFEMRLILKAMFSESSPVKVNITSFRVPELSINLPETATVANLKASFS